MAKRLCQTGLRGDLPIVIIEKRARFPTVKRGSREGWAKRV